MSVNTSSNSQSAQKEPAQATSAASNGNAQPRAEGKSWGFFSMSPQGGIGRNGSSQVLARASEQISAILKELPPQQNRQVSYVKIDRLKERCGALSSIMIVVTDTVEKKLAYHTLLLEENAEGFAPRTFQDGRNSVSMPRYTGDAYNDTYISFLSNAAQRLGQGKNVLDAAATIVPVDFHWEDKTGAATNLVVNAVIACISNLDANSNDPELRKDLDFSNYDGNGRLQVAIEFGGDQVENYAGFGVRSDVKMVMKAISNDRRDNEDVNSPEQEEPIAYIRGYIDQAYVKKENNDWNINPNDGPKPCFAQRFVVTGMECTARLNLTSQLLTLYGAMGLNSDYGWRPNYNQRWSNKAQTDTMDIGAFNIEANFSRDPSGFGTKIDTRSGNFDEKARTDFLRSMLHPTIAIAIDVAPAGAETWYNDVFYHAANGNIDAIRAINRAADTLTGGKFRTFWDRDEESPVLVNRELIHYGYYESADGRRDLRYASAYLPVANVLGVNDSQALIDWNESFAGEDRTEAKRLAARLDMIRNVVASKIVVQQLARRITFRDDWAEAFQKACAAAKIMIQIVNPELTGDFRAQRTVAQWFERGSLRGNAQGSFYHSAGGKDGGYGGYRGPSGGQRHWGATV